MKRFPLLCLLTATSAAFAAPPNVLFIITDQQAADALSCRMGARYLHTPALDRLAGHGTFFSRAYAANPLCMPSRNAMFTGHYPHQIGITHNAHARLHPNPFPCLGTYFQRAGYETVYCGKWHLGYPPKSAADHGFARAHIGKQDDATEANAIRFLRGPHHRPFLLVASFVNPHNACQLARGEPLPDGPIGRPPPPAADLPPAPANLDPPRGETDTMALMRRAYHANPMFPVGGFTVLDWRKFRWGYYRLIEKVDAQIGRVLDALRAAGLDRNTVIVFTSDHGECAGAHGWNQKTVLYEESVRVPLIIRPAGDHRARTTDRLVNTGIDLLPTLLDFAGIARPAGLPGRSLRALAEGQPVARWRDEVVSEDDLAQAGAIDGFIPVTQGRMVRTERFKYCVYTYGRHRESLVDLQRDPGEMVNLARNPAYHGVLLDMQQRLRRFAQANGDTLALTMLADNVGPRPFPHLPEGTHRKARRHPPAADRD